MNCNPSAFTLYIRASATKLVAQRMKDSDGICPGPDETKGDHFPDARGIPHAVDITQSTYRNPNWKPGQFSIFDAHAWGDIIAKRIAAGLETRIKYLVSHNYVTGKAKVWSLEKPYWHDQDGDTHITHLHISINYTQEAEDSVEPFWVGYVAQEGQDVPYKPTDTVKVLNNKFGCWRMTANGGIYTLRGKYHGSYLGLSEEQRQGVRSFTDITPRVKYPDADGYTLWSDDGHQYEFPPV